MTQQAEIAIIPADDLEQHIGALGALLHACVADGASVNFVLPFTQEQAETFWRNKVRPGLQSGTKTLLVARINGQIAGTVQLDYDTPPNQPHRAEVAKLLVHPGSRRLGIAKALMAALEQHASQIGRSLITLDTRTGDTAEPLYTALGYTSVGSIPGYCLDPIGDRLDATTIMYKQF